MWSGIFHNDYNWAFYSFFFFSFPISVPKNTCWVYFFWLLSPHYCLDMKAQPESAIHTPFTKRQPYQATTSTSSMLDVFLQDKGLPPSSSVSSSSSLPQQTTSSPHVVPPPASSLPKMAGVPSLGQQVSPSSSDAQGSSPLPLQQHKIKQQKKRASINTKVTFNKRFWKGAR